MLTDRNSVGRTITQHPDLTGTQRNYPGDWVDIQFWEVTERIRITRLEFPEAFADLSSVFEEFLSVFESEVAALSN